MQDGLAPGAVEATVTKPAELVNEQLQDIANGFWVALPNIIAGVIFLFLAWLVGKLIKRVIAKIAQSRGRPDLGTLLGTVIQGIFMIAAILTAAAIVFPSVEPGDVFAGLGIGSVAIGFAFKDILQNLFAGLLILIRRPYAIGDQILVDDFEGTVEHVESRATFIRTYDGKRVIIPNSDIYTKAVVVNTAHVHRRDEYDVGIGYGEDPLEVAELFREAVRDVAGVLNDPPPECFPWDLAPSTFNLRVRWHVLSERRDLVMTRSRVLTAIFQTALDHDIDLPYPTSVSLVKGDRLDDALLEAGAAADPGVPELTDETDSTKA
ncbi:MAG: mechanosensitive ion channel family protein [Pacificimonas sp.]